MPPSWPLSADSDEHARASGAVPPQRDAAREASAALIPARRRSKARHLLQQPLEDSVSSAETPADRENVQGASPNSGIVTEAAAQAAVCHVIITECRCLLHVLKHSMFLCCCYSNSSCFLSVFQTWVQ